MESFFNFDVAKKLPAVLLSFMVGAFLFSCRNEHEPDRRKEPQEQHVSGSEREDERMMPGHGGMMDGGGMMSGDRMSEEMHRAMMSGEMGPEMMDDMRTIRKMLQNHEKISRQVEELDNGVKTRTTSNDPEIAAAIQRHVRQMKRRMESREPIRQMDPLFRELFRYADKIDIDIEDLENGVLVIETSEDPQAVKLIKQHAHRAVSEFAEQGMSRAMQPTPLPEGYSKD